MDSKVINLLKKRQKLREQGKFEVADSIRVQIEAMGYDVIDGDKDSDVVKKTHEVEQGAHGSFLALFGSGEISSTGRMIHENIFKKMGKKKIRISIVTTPAGFQPNVKAVHEEIADFFKTSLSNYKPSVDIIYANTAQLANDPNIIAPLEVADYIFVGPGSPTYAVRNLSDTLLLSRARDRILNNASLCLASASAIAFSRYCLPVYEIYKAGIDLYWEEGLGFYKDFIDDISIVPHYDNTEGGAKLDTSRCYMGKNRFNKLLSILPAKTKLLGIDEHTAVVVDLDTKKQVAYGKGDMHII